MTQNNIKSTTGKSNTHTLVDDIRGILAVLRGADGCPWDRKQTHRSLLKYLIEESDEVKSEIEENRLGSSLKEELGDLILQVFLHAQIAEEDNRFNFYDVLERLKEKLLFRHPHIFGKNKRTLTDEELDIQWNKLKMQEKQMQKNDEN